MIPQKQQTIMKSVEIKFSGEDGGMRLDMALSRTIRTLSRNALQKLIRSGCVTIDGTQATAPDRIVSGGEILKVVYADDSPNRSNIPFCMKMNTCW